MMPRDNGSPLVSIIVVSDGDHRFTEAAVRSALRQTMRSLEVIVAVPGTPDEDIANDLDVLARQDDRLRLFRVPNDEATASQRNRCLDIARGEWVTTLGHGDLMHPARLERLLIAAEHDAADIVCDNVLIFDEENVVPPRSAATGVFARTPTLIDASRYLEFMAPVGSSDDRYRPLIRLELVRESGVRYDPGLLDNADFDLGLKLLIRGARFLWCPELTYFSRRGDRIDTGRRAAVPPSPRRCEPVPRPDILVRARIRIRRWSRAIVALGRTSAALVRRTVSRPQATEPSQRNVCIISRQRVIGRTNGSSTYLIGLATALASRGMRVHLVCPTPATFGRMPVFTLRPEMAVFDSISIRGSVRIGNIVAAVDPRVVLHAVCAVVGRLLQMVGLPAERLTRPAPYAIRLPWHDADFLYLARHARPRADVILADYAFLTDAIPYVLRPDAPSAVVMHDLVSSRAAEYGPLGGDATVSTLDVATEMKMLAQADTIVAIQATEAAVVGRHLPRHEVIVAPLAVEPVAASQPGNGAELLFVASKTTANIDGLEWFIGDVWPAVLNALPATTLLVAGAVGEMFPAAPPGVRILGHVPDLAPLYGSAGVVISPLRGGSGLKIKLIEAMAQGKAIVATTTTLQGVEDIVGPAVSVTDDAAVFAAAIIALLSDDDLRRRQADAALDVARSRFSAEACYAGFLTFMCRGEASRELAMS
jgi:succinoglycan biosynthesis protein ExoO